MLQLDDLRGFGVLAVLVSHFSPTTSKLLAPTRLIDLGGLGLAANYEFGSHSAALPGGGNHFVVALKATKGLGRCPPLRSIEPEIVAKLARTGCRIYEAGVSYSGRTYAEGKKVRWKDGVRAIYVILKYNLKRRHVIERR